MSIISNLLPDATIDHSIEPAWWLYGEDSTPEYPMTHLMTEQHGLTIIIMAQPDIHTGLFRGMAIADYADPEQPAGTPMETEDTHEDLTCLLWNLYQTVRNAQ